MKVLAAKIKSWNLLNRKSAQWLAVVIMVACIMTCIYGIWTAFTVGQSTVWDLISNHEEYLRGLYVNSTQTELKAWLSDAPMNFTNGLVWESQLLSYTQNRPQYQNVAQVLRNGKGACGEFVWVYGAFCVAKNISFRVVTVGYFVPNVVDHSWVQVNPSHDGKTWIHVEVTDSCDQLRKGNTINQLWNVTINNNACYNKNNYKMVLAYQLNEDGEIVITDVTATFS
jgi:hypothetical protein